MKQLFFTLSLLLTAWCSNAQNLSWTKEPSLPNALYSPHSFAIGTHVYVVGGVEAYAPVGYYPAVMSHFVWDFNTVTNTWTQKNNYPGIPMYDGKAFAINGYGYVVTGSDSTGTGNATNEMWQYNPTTDSWVQKAPFPAGSRYNTATFVLNGKVYVACGFNYSNEVWCYDPATDTWTQKNNFPGGPRQAPGCLVIGGYAYLGLGATGDGRGSYFVQSDWYRYDTTGDTWTRLADFPGDAAYATSNFVLNGEGYVVNGLDQHSVYYNTSTAVNTSDKVWKYAPSTDTWTLWGVFPDSSSYDGSGVASGNAGYMGFGAHNFNTLPLSRNFYRFGPGTAPYSCAVTLNKFTISNSVYNFQANGNFSPGALVTWDFGDSSTGTGTSVVHNYPVTGHYTVTVSISDTGSACSNSATDTINVTGISNCSAIINSTAYDTLVTLSASIANGVGPYTYNWSCTSDSTFGSILPDPTSYVSHNSSRNFCLTVTDATGCVANTCTSVANSGLFFPTPCQTYLVIYPDSTLPGWYLAIIYTSSTTPVQNLSYLWDFGDGTTSTLEFPDHTYTTPGQYTLCLTTSDGAGCTATFCDSAFYAYKYGGGPMNHFRSNQRQALGVKDITAASAIEVYPNPANAEITINAAGQKIDNATIYNTEGQIVASAKSPALNKMSINELASGIYFVEIKVKDTTTRVKFVKAN